MKKIHLRKYLIAALLVLVLVIFGGLGYLKFILPDVAAAPSISIPVNEESVARGKYLAEHVTVCMDCHSTRDWSRFSGPLVEGTLGKGGEYFGPEMGFPGRFYAKNITPASLNSWSDGEIFRAITTGVSKDGHVLFPVMPYANYGRMSEQDIYAIIAYIRTLPAIENEVQISKADFPMSLILNTIPVDANLQELPNPSDEVAYGAYLANAASCIECHSPVDKGRVIKDLAFSGGREFVMPSGVLRTPNITPDPETGIGTWSKEAFIGRFKAYESRESLAVVQQGGYNSIMPWTMYAGMTEEDLGAIYTYLRTLEPLQNQVVVYTPN